MQNIGRHIVVARFEALAEPNEQRFQSAQNHFAGFIRSAEWPNETQSSSKRIKALPSNGSWNGNCQLKFTRLMVASIHFLFSSQESDILESPQVYCRSNLGDKISDYEDLWTQDNGNNQSTTTKETIMSSFRSTTAQRRKPDTPAESRKYINLTLCPTPSSLSSHSPSNRMKILFSICSNHHITE